MVKIIGELKYAEKPLFAPLSERKCAVYKIIVEEYRSSGRSGSWIEIINDKNCTNFYLKNGNSYALIKPTPSELLLNKDANYKSGTFNEATSFLNEYINRFGKKSKGLFGFNKSMRYKEGILEEGEIVAVLGKGKWIDVQKLENVDLSKTGKVDKLLVIEQLDEDKLYISDESEITL
jgi:hypothetical protein